MQGGDTWPTGRMEDDFKAGRVLKHIFYPAYGKNVDLSPWNSMEDYIAPESEQHQLAYSSHMKINEDHLVHGV